MVSEHEKLDIGTAYYKDGFTDGQKQGFLDGQAQGREEGREEGEAHGRAQVAKNLLNHGMSVAEVANMTEVPIDMVESLSQS